MFLSSKQPHVLFISNSTPCNFSWKIFTSNYAGRNPPVTLRCEDLKSVNDDDDDDDTALVDCEHKNVMISSNSEKYMYIAGQETGQLHADSALWTNDSYCSQGKLEKRILKYKSSIKKEDTFTGR